MKMAIQEARGILTLYQSKLGLNDWKIRLKWGKASELYSDQDGAKLYGFVYWDNTRKKAWITLNRDYPRDEIIETIKHELLHVRLEGHREEPLSVNSSYESSLDAIAAAL